MENQGWQYVADNGSFPGIGYTGNQYTKGEHDGEMEVAIVQATARSENQVNVVVVEAHPGGSAGSDALLLGLAAVLIIAVVAVIFVYHHKIMRMVEKETTTKPKRRSSG
jgi:hypothetical protein